jgi:glycosyltransferase involved in cell wall biosynthesis
VFGSISIGFQAERRSFEMRPRTFLSIIITAYNIEEYIDKAINSVLSQSFKDYEMIIVDDGSQDNTMQVIQRMTSHVEPKPLILGQSNRGAGGARNRAIAESKGEYLVFLDGDDWLLPDALSSLAVIARTTGADIVCSNRMDYWDKDGKVKVGARFKEIHGDSPEKCPEIFGRIAIHGKAFRRGFLEEFSIRFPEQMAVEDFPFSYLAYACARLVATTSKVTYAYRHRAGENRSLTQRRLTDFALESRFRQIELTQKIVSDTRLGERFPSINFSRRDFQTRLMRHIKWFDEVEATAERSRLLAKVSDFLRKHETVVMNSVSKGVRPLYAAIISGDEANAIARLAEWKLAQAKKKMQKSNESAHDGGAEKEDSETKTRLVRRAAPASFLEDLARDVRERTETFKAVYRQWFYRDNCLVHDLRLEGNRIAVDLILSDDEIRMILFGRSRSASRYVEKFVHHASLDVLEKKGRKHVIGCWKRGTQESVVMSQFSRLLSNLLAFQERSDGVATLPKDEDDSVRAMNERIVYRIKQKMRSQGARLNVGFVVSDNTKWNCESLWYEMRQARDIHARIFVVPTGREKDAERKVLAYKKEVEFFREVDRSLVELWDYANRKARDLSDFDLDVVFYQQPWGGLKNLPKRMVGHALSAYFHYGYIVYANSRMQYGLKYFHPFLWKYFAQSEIQRSIVLDYDQEAQSRVVVTGYPKLDVYRTLRNGAGKTPFDSLVRRFKKKIIYAPHHSLEKEALKISTFDWNCRIFLEWAEMYGEYAWAYKPHARLRYTVEKNDVMTRQEYEEYECSWRNLSNAIVFDKGGYFDLFVGSDVLITDSGSFLGEYFPTGNPIIWLAAKNPAVSLNKVGKALATTFYRVSNERELRETFESVVVSGVDPKKEARLNLIEDLFPGEKKSASSRVIDCLRSEFGMSAP